MLALVLLLAACPGGPAKERGAGQGILPPIPLGGVWHRVARGTTAAALARRYRVPRVDIEEINGLTAGESLEIGRELFIPGAQRSLSPRPAPPVGAAARSAGVRLLWPVRGGKLTSRFGARGKSKHEGIDIAAPEGSAVLAAADGKVIYAGSGVRGYGNLILVRHGAGMVTVYAHNRRNLVKEGHEVKQGQVIAEVGHTGRASGDHLHFEVRRGDVPVDPLDHVKPE